jgi:hypothetical protein
MMSLNSESLDKVYSELCKQLESAGQENAQLYLARLCLLALSNLDEAKALRLINEAPLKAGMS